MTADPRRMTEMDLHMYVVGLLNHAAAPWVQWFHVPNGEKRDAVTGAKLKRMGAKPGVFDLVIMVPGEHVAFLEIKGDGGSLSPAQKEWALAVKPLGCKTAWVRTPEQAHKLLVEWGAIRQRNRAEIA